MRLLEAQKYKTEPQKQNKTAFKLKKIKVPLFIIQQVKSNPQLFKTLSVYFHLKALADDGGWIIDYTPNRYKISSFLGFGSHGVKLHNQKNKLIKLGLIKQLGKNIHLVSLQELYTIFKAKDKTYTYINTPVGRRMEYAMLAALEKKQVAANEKAYSLAVTMHYGIEGRQAEILKKELFDTMVVQFAAGLCIRPQKPYVHFDTNLSQAQIARLFGCASTSSGAYWNTRLMAEGFIHTQARQVESVAKYPHQTSVYGKVFYSRQKGCNILRLRNQISFLC